MSTQQLTFSRYGRTVAAIMEDQGFRADVVEDVAEELQGILRASGLIVARDVLVDHLCDTEGENTEVGYQLAREIFEALKLKPRGLGGLLLWQFLERA